MPFVQAVVEDILQETVLRKLIHTYRTDIEIIGVLNKGGSNYIKQNIKGFNSASIHCINRFRPIPLRFQTYLELDKFSHTS